MQLKDRVAVITGGTRGVGLAIAKAYAENGMKVVVLGRNSQRVLDVEQQFLNAGYICKGLTCDVTDIDSIENTLKIIWDEYKEINVIVNNAGILDKCTIEEMQEQWWDEVMATNLKGMFFVMQKALPYLEKSHAPRIINIASNAGRMGGYENGLAYTASKGGVIALTYGAARRLAAKGITVNCIAPGTIETDMASNYDDAAKQRLIARFPVGRLGKPEEVATAACYFASVESGFTTGAVLDVNGGMFMG